MNSMKDIAPFALAIGALLLGPVSTMIIQPVTSVDSYAFGAIDALLVNSAIQLSYFGYMNISKRRGVAG